MAQKQLVPKNDVCCLEKSNLYKTLCFLKGVKNTFIDPITAIIIVETILSTPHMRIFYEESFLGILFALSAKMGELPAISRKF